MLPAQKRTVYTRLSTSELRTPKGKSSTTTPKSATPELHIVATCDPNKKRPIAEVDSSSAESSGDESTSTSSRGSSTDAENIDGKLHTIKKEINNKFKEAMRSSRANSTEEYKARQTKNNEKQKDDGTTRHHGMRRRWPWPMGDSDYHCDVSMSLAGSLPPEGIEEIGTATTTEAPPVIVSTNRKQHKQKRIQHRQVGARVAVIRTAHNGFAQYICIRPENVPSSPIHARLDLKCRGLSQPYYPRPDTDAGEVGAIFDPAVHGTAGMAKTSDKEDLYNVPALPPDLNMLVTPHDYQEKGAAQIHHSDFRVYYAAAL
ncbi:hypothetical protein PV11_02119 [Exophiala sideris]|uniref:Uncharacterized protein n=1 Tax=Exophiala sideris TaxID=1016849 RepID=A0A0D1YYE8_9EURO|nr:hypothetical protein PV11_02119 [Exophiala sideris]